MPRRFFRKYLPRSDGLRSHRLTARFGRFLDAPGLWHLNRDSVAGAVAIGLFAGLIPGPLQMLTALLLAVVLRRNLAIALLTTLYTNPFTIVPLYLLAWGYGSLLLGGAAGELAAQPFAMDWSNLRGSLDALLDWMFVLGKPLAVGLPALALTLAALGYLVVQFGWRLAVRLAWRARLRRRVGGR
ncbi:MAG: DUF2062 domain-containing protein [Betaproteobacteria bacterium]|nr:DUF2062 domain-containing protein [Betaproteobacteria bacterium]